MKFILTSSAIIIALSFSSCGGSSTKGSSSSSDSASGNVASSSNAQPAAPTMTINETDWTDQDLSTIAPLIHLSMKVPKGAKMEKNGNGGVDIHVCDFYLITVSTLAVNSIKEAMDGDKSLTVTNTSYINGKVLTEEPNGMVYSIQMKTEANGTTYEPETHFAYYVGKPDGAFYSILDARPLDNYSVRGSAYTADIANKIYGIVKGSAKEI